MKKLEAGQQIYTNVEKKQSPSGREGFQTLFYTHSALTEAEVEEIEARLLYFASEREPIKRLFFVTSTGKCVVGQITPLPEPDRFGRKGRYIAHALIFTREEFAGFGGNPFTIFGNFQFIATVEEALRKGDFESGDIPSISVEVKEVDEESLQALSGWGKEELKELALLALRARQMAKEFMTVAFVGEPEQVEMAIRASIFGVPTALRQYCTFDSYFYRCNLVSTYYWGIGLLDRPTNPNLIVVDARLRRVLSEVAITPQSTYERWLMAEIDAYNLNAVSRYKDIAFALAEWLDGREHDQFLLESVPSEVIASVFKAGLEQVRLRLLTRICEHLPLVLAQKVLEPICHQSAAGEIFKRLREGFSLWQLLDVLNEVYASRVYYQPGREELQALGEVLRSAEHRGLRLLYLCWTGQLNQLRKMLEKMSEGEYRRFVQTALQRNFVDPLHLIVPNKGDAFLDIYLAGVRTQRCDWLALVKALLDAGEAKCLVRLTESIPQWSPESIRRAAKFLGGRHDVPEAFRRAVNRALESIKPVKGFKNRLKNWLRSVFGHSDRGTENLKRDERKR